MTELTKRINQLPQVLQDYIGEFNVLHRKLLSAALNDINNLTFNCCYCDNTTRKTEEINQYVLNFTFACCSEYCAFNHGHEFRRNYYKYNRRI